MTATDHQSLILDQFTRQATLFSTAAPITNEDALLKIVEAAQPSPTDTVLDVACGGVIDTCASEDPAKAAEFNRLEKLRDPSHVRNLTLAELKGLFAAFGLAEAQASFYELRDEVKNLLARSFPNPGDDVKIIEMFIR